MRRREVLGRVLAVLVLAAVFSRGDSPAQTPPTARATAVTPDPAGRLYTRYADGLFARRVFATPSPDRDYVVEVWRFSVPPATKSAQVVLPGAAALVVQLGAVVVTTANQQKQLRLGDSLLLPEGERVSFVNPDRLRPLNMRVVILRGEGRP